ncbi:unnamed protein product [Spirodela intermedia]|uniref:Uncharacterized protein n=1 Tax=Spirodela intermedia TaxID=51605 RepID=A0A7I8J261_SPIIN|nr:unnamed protein product [Spirodela intermedia]CAA6664062.1 unnamed protein product [Spirodela intermedia]
MTLRWWASRDSAAFKCLVGLAILYGVMSYVAYNVVYVRHVRPLGVDAPPDRFSEARAIEHVRYLTVDIDGRQVYIKNQLEMMKERAGPGYRLDIDEMSVSGSFNMMFLRHSLSLGYRNHTNILFRISSEVSNYTEPAVLVNGHFDSPLGSPGAGDCGSCVASMLELVRVILDSSWIPPQPIIFLFNGAEEIFLLGSHGFMKTHEWANSLGAFINVEASGSGGLDLVCQSGPGSWPSLVYAQSAVYPMAQSAAQDVFGIIPGDTDFRIFAKDFGKIPGLDIIFVLGGYYYHTSHDTLERLMPGSIQARGENLYALVKAFTASPLLRNAEQRSQVDAAKDPGNDRAVYFDYLSWFMIIYSRRVALVLHNLPVVIFLLMPLLLHFQHCTVSSVFSSFLDLTKGVFFHAMGISLGIFVPVSFAVLRLCFSRYAMSWYARPYLAYMMFIPCSIVGLLIPRTVWGSFSVSQEVAFPGETNEVLFDKVCFWGLLVCMAYTLSGLGGGFVTFLHAASMLLAWIFFCLSSKYFGHKSFRSLAGYVIPLIPDLLYSVYFGAFLVQFVIEKMGMMGSLPHPYGYFIPDIIVAAVVGLVTGLCVGPLLPVVGRWMARSSVVNFLLQVTVVAMAVSSQLFPYSTSAPKRVAFHHTFVTADSGKLLESSYEFSVLDANSLGFLFKYSPEAAKLLEVVPESSIQHSDPSSWVFPAQGDGILHQYEYLPRLSHLSSTEATTGARKIHLEVELGSVSEIWAVVLNITGPLGNWSFADNAIPVPERINGGPPSYICRLSGKSHENWAFWLEASSSEALRVDLAVLDQYLLDGPKRLKGLFPNWVDVIASSPFFQATTFDPLVLGQSQRLEWYSSITNFID